MTRTRFFPHALALAALLALPVAQGANIDKASYKAGKTRISDEYKAASKACNAQSANAKDICVQEAKAKEKVARAELEYSYTGTDKDRTKVMVVKAESTYAVAKERCDDEKGNNKDVCVKTAKAAEVKAKADAKMGKQITEAKTDAAQAKADADYKVAAEKCDSLAGDAKSTCVSSAKARFGKS